MSESELVGGGSGELPGEGSLGTYGTEQGLRWWVAINREGDSPSPVPPPALLSGIPTPQLVNECHKGRDTSHYFQLKPQPA